jgi:uncharacterized membrane protein (DUF106 family)
LDRLEKVNNIVQEMAKLQNLQKRVEEFKVEVVKEVEKRRNGGRVKDDFEKLK